MTQADYQYFQGRAAEEDEAAHRAKCVEAHISHQELADAYRARCREILSNGVLPARLALEPSQVVAVETQQASAPMLRTAFGLAPTAAPHEETLQPAAG